MAKTDKPARPAAKRAPAKRTPAKRATPARRTPARADDGQFEADHHVRNTALGATALLGLAAVGLAAAFRFGLFARLLPAGDGHAADDLAGDARPAPTDRAPPAFRPDMDAPMTAAEREALRPAPGLTPAMTADTEVVAVG